MVPEFTCIAPPNRLAKLEAKKESSIVKLLKSPHLIAPPLSDALLDTKLEIEIDAVDCSR